MFDLLNLDYPGLEEIKKIYNEGKVGEAKEKLLLYFKERKSVKGYLGTNKKKLREKLLTDYFDEFIKIKEQGDRFLKKEIIFDMKWDMERCKKPYIFKEEIEWEKVPFKDPEWTYMLNRHKHWLLYGQNYLATENEIYTEGFKRELNHWVKNATLDSTGKKLTWRTIEAGIRCRNWVKTLEYFLDSDALDVETLENLILSLNIHMNYIIESSKETRLLSNWVILENHGLFIASVFFPEFKISKKALKLSEKYVEKALEIQVLPDGLHWEQSFMYHNEMINCLLDMITIAERNNIKLSEKIYSKGLKMAKATESFMEPTFTQGNYGDSDKEDLRDILALASVVLKDKNLKNNIERLPIENLFSLGYEGLQYFNSLEPSEKKYKSIANEASGNYILRNGWGKESVYSFFKCGSLGSGHGHYDLLHFHINYKGEDLIVDSGRYNYAEDNPYRVTLKEAKCHNSFLIDDKEFSIAKGSWGSNGVATVVKRPHYFGNLADFVEGGHLGYIDKGIFVNRKLIYIKDKLWIASDEIFSTGKHNYKAYFNFNKENIEIKNNLGKNIVNYKSEKGNFKIIPLDNQKISIEDSYVSKEYNEIYKSKKAILEADLEGNSSFNTVLYMEDGEKINSIEYLPILDWKNKELDSKYSKAIKISFEKESYIILIVNDEEPSGRKTYIIDGHVVYGRVAIIKIKEKESFTEVLSY